MTLWKWSRTASTNATADSTCPFPEGMNPGAVNDGTRGMMAAAAKYRDDIAGAIVSSGTSSAYALSSYQGYDSLAHLDGAMIAFTPHTGNAGAVTLNVDGQGAKPLRYSPGVDLPSNALVLGTPYVATYYNTAGEWILQGGAFTNPFGIPLGVGVEYWADVAPNSAFAFPIGQAVPRTGPTSKLFDLFGTKYGSGDGSTTFNLPDKRGRVSAMFDAGNATGRLNGAYTGGVNGAVLGGVGGEQGHLLTGTEMPSHSHNNSIVDPGHVHPVAGGVFGGTNQTTLSLNAGGQLSVFNSAAIAVSPAVTGVTINNAAAGAGAVHNVVQPTIVCNYILRII